MGLILKRVLDEGHWAGRCWRGMAVIDSWWVRVFVTNAGVAWCLEERCSASAASAAAEAAAAAAGGLGTGTSVT